jgi:hypothetical protein
MHGPNCEKLKTSGKFPSRGVSCGAVRRHKMFRTLKKLVGKKKPEERKKTYLRLGPKQRYTSLVPFLLFIGPPLSFLLSSCHLSVCCGTILAAVAWVCCLRGHLVIASYCTIQINSAVTRHRASKIAEISHVSHLF